MIPKTRFQNSVLNYNDKTFALSGRLTLFASHMINLIKRSMNFIKLQRFLKQLILIMVSCMLLTSCKANNLNGFFKQKDSIPTEPVWYPIDVTKKGTKLEVVVRVEIEDTYGFYLCFYNDMLKYKNHKRKFGQYGPTTFTFWEGVRSFFPSKPLPPLTAEELKNYYRLSDIVRGDSKYVNGKFVEIKKSVPTPVKIQLFSAKGVKMPVFYFDEKTREVTQVPDEGIEPELHSWGESYDKTIGVEHLKPGVYKIIIETLKDAPEFKGIRVEFGFHTTHRPK